MGLDTARGWHSADGIIARVGHRGEPVVPVIWSSGCGLRLITTGMPLSRLDATRLDPTLRERPDLFAPHQPEHRLIGGRRTRYTPAYEALARLIRRVNIEDGVGLHVPAEYHANTSELVQMLEKGHHNVRLDRYRPYPSAEDIRDVDHDNEPRVIRGGSFHDRPQRCRSSFRLSYPAWQRVHNVGFRVVCDAADRPGGYGGDNARCSRSSPKIVWRIDMAKVLPMPF